MVKLNRKKWLLRLITSIMRLSPIALVSLQVFHAKNFSFAVKGLKASCGEDMKPSQISEAFVIFDQFFCA